MGIQVLMGAALAAVIAWAPQDAADHRLYGRVELEDGRVLEGFLRWGRGASGWSDLLAGFKELPQEKLRQAQRLRAEADPEAARAARSIVYGGVRITWDEDDSEVLPDTAQSGVAFGHVESLSRQGQAARLHLKSGLTVELSASDRRAPLVDSVRVEPAGVEGVWVPWGVIARVGFLAPPPGAAPAAARLHGTVVERDGTEHTGYLTFDGGRSLTTDAAGRRRAGEASIPFSQVERLAWQQGSGSARATLTGGETATLEAGPGGGRSLRINDPGLGGVQISLGSVAEVRLHPPAREGGYAAYDGGHRLRGTVTTREGARVTGFVRWDNDEEHSWEILNGSARGASYTVELANVLEIRTDNPRRARVTLRDGRQLDLSGSNDVGQGNKGLVIEGDDGRFHWVDWVQLARFQVEGS